MESSDIEYIDFAQSYKKQPVYLMIRKSEYVKDCKRLLSKYHKWIRVAVRKYESEQNLGMYGATECIADIKFSDINDNEYSIVWTHDELMEYKSIECPKLRTSYALLKLLLSNGEPHLELFDLLVRN